MNTSLPDTVNNLSASEVRMTDRVRLLLAAFGGRPEADECCAVIERWMSLPEDLRPVVAGMIDAINKVFIEVSK